MARAKRYSAEQIVAKLREHEKLQAQGLTILQACKRIGISDQTFYRWRIRYGALKEDEAPPLGETSAMSTVAAPRRASDEVLKSRRSLADLRRRRRILVSRG